MQKQVAFAYTFLGYEQCRLNEKRQQQRRRCHRCVAAAAAPAAAEAAEINHGVSGSRQLRVVVLVRSNV